METQQNLRFLNDVPVVEKKSNGKGDIKKTIGHVTIFNYQGNKIKNKDHDIKNNGIFTEKKEDNNEDNDQYIEKKVP